MNNNFRWTSLLIALTTAAAVAGCSGLAAFSQKTGEAEQTDGGKSGIVQSPSPNPSQSNPISNQPELYKSGVTKNANSAKIQALLTRFKLVNNQTIYTWGAASKGTLRVYRSTDGGKNWADISPRPAVQMSDADDNLFAASDSQHLMLFPFQKDGFRKTMYSKDGGKSWSEGPALKYAMSAETSFISATQGFLLTETDAAMGRSGKVFYKTKDGGATWQKLMDNASSSLSSEDERAKGLLPQYGFTGYGVSFRDAKNGWAPLQSREGTPHLARTKDGGGTWKLVDLSKAGDWSRGNPQITAAPTFFGKDRKQGWMPLRLQKDKTSDIGGFRTVNGGDSWSYVPFAADLPSSNMVGVPVFVSADEGWFWNGTGLMHTADGAKSWVEIGRDPVFAKSLTTFPNLKQLEFTDSLHGWALLASQDQSHSRLIKSEDGGRSWIII